MKLLLDEMWPHDAATQLRGRGHDVVAVVERPELRGNPDSVVFDAAQVELRAVVTENVSDYRALALHYVHDRKEHNGLVFTTDRRYPRHDPRTLGRLITGLHELLDRNPDLRNREHWLQ